MNNILPPEPLNLTAIQTVKSMAIVIKEWLSSTGSVKNMDTLLGHTSCLRHRMDFRTDKGTLLNLSIQAGEDLYSSPSETSLEYGFYKQVELGYPSWTFSRNFIEEYAEDVSEPLDTVYPYVPLEVLAEELLKAVRTL